MQKLETGSYTRYQTPDGSTLEVFLVLTVGGDDMTDALEPGRYYYLPSDDADPVGPFATEQQALDAAY